MSSYNLLRRGKVAAGGSIGFGLILSIAFAAPCVAQDVIESGESEVDETTIEEIIVTGSRIKRRDFNTISPLTTIGSEDFDFSGQATIEETLNQMPQVTPDSGRTTNRTGHENAGTATVNLRGLGAGRSLVLLNGRRVAPSGISNAVDLNNIPELLIDRVEIITGGTSTVYGSDAIAGVVNFITKDDFSGFGVDAGLSLAEQGDAETYDLSVAYGHDLANGLGNVTVYVNMLDRRSLLASEREHSRVPYIDDWEGNLVVNGSWETPAGVVRWPEADLGDGPVLMTFDPDGTPREFDEIDDTYNWLAANYLQIPLKRLAAGAMGHYNLSARFEAYVEASLVRNEPSQKIAPVPMRLPIEVNIDNPVLAPEAQQLFAENYVCAPDLACFVFGKRLLEMGPRLAEFERDYARLVAGFSGELAKGWDIDGWVTYTTESSTQYLRNDASRSRLRQGLLVDSTTNLCFDPAGGCVPLDIFGAGNLSAEGGAFLRLADFVNRTERTHKLASVFVNGSPFDTWAGPLDMAVGAEWRSDDTSFKSDDTLESGDALGWSARPSVEGNDYVYEIYAEAVVPLATNQNWAEYLGVEVGARYSEHKHAGGFWTYKAGAEWQPIDGFRVRAMHQRSLRAPNSGELFKEQATVAAWFVGSDPIEDPCSASSDPRGNGNVEKCVLQGLPEDQIGIFEATPRYPVDYLIGGNPDLKPEDGETWTVGAVISPDTMPNWTFTVDYYALEVADTIGDIFPSEICFDPVNTGHVFCEDMVRDDTGNVAFVSELIGNRGLMETTGIDTQIQFRADLPDFLSFRGHIANISMNVYWTHVLTDKEQESPVTEVLECAGYWGWPCNSRAYTHPENRVTSKIHYASGPLGLHLNWRWIDGTINAAPKLSYIEGYPDPDLAIPVVDDEHYLDLGISYQLNDRLSSQFGVNNLLDNSPPQMDGGANTDTGMYDIFGRSYYLTLSMQFSD
ncbi:MAG: TonB-dependent receptor [Gammaproteobacteria bacterium]|nr:TonB-dependent receptor [Gammaproteobacteria bacterium]